MDYKRMLKTGYISEIARCFNDQIIANDLLEDAKIPLERVIVPFSLLPPETYWREICKKLDHGIILNGLFNLLTEAVRYYPGNSLFKQALAEFSNPVPNE